MYAGCIIFEPCKIKIFLSYLPLLSNHDAFCMQSQKKNRIENGNFFRQIELNIVMNFLL
jgi:hypothetical protein